MSDLIDRQAICDALDKAFADRINRFGYESYEKADEKTQLVCDGIIDAIDVVLGLPSVQPETNCSEFPNNSDTISRQAAINAFKKELTVGESKGNYVTICSAIGYEGAKQILESLPSAQPDACENACEIERKSNDTISRQQAVDELIAMREHIDAGMSVIGCTAYEMAIEALREPEYTEQDVRDSFNSEYACGMEAAQPERKRGKWIPQDYNQRHGNISTTVYYYPKCSVCGCSGDYTDAFCKSCGADMRGDEHETN